MSAPTYVLPSEGMLSVLAMNTRQINVMSNQIFEQKKRINLLHDQVVLMGSQLQSTQVHISTVDARVPSFMVITDVLKQMLAGKINEVVHCVTKVLEVRSAVVKQQHVLAGNVEVLSRHGFKRAKAGL